jgi:hypothetical protein
VNDQRTEDKGARVQIALAEFNALRSEIISHSTTQAGLIVLAVTAIGLVGGFVIKDDGDPKLLLILPFLVSAAGIHSAEQGRGIALMGTYIRDLLWPYLNRIYRADGLAGEEMPSWEQTVTDFRNRRNHTRRWTHPSFLLLSGLPGTLIFFFGSLVPLVVVNFVNDADMGKLFPPDIYRVVWWLAVVLLVAHAALALTALSLGRPLWRPLRTTTRQGAGRMSSGPRGLSNKEPSRSRTPRATRHHESVARHWPTGLRASPGDGHPGR